MRIITGEFGGRVLTIPRNLRARPTTDRAREALMNILMSRCNIPDLSVLDLFSGTGIIGIELLSLGAKSVVSVDKDPVHCQAIRQNLKTLNITTMTVVNTDAFKYITRAISQFDLIFADPPYDHPRIPELSEQVFKSNILSPGGIFILEHGPDIKTSPWAFFKELRNYGKVHFSFFMD